MINRFALSFAIGFGILAVLAWFVNGSAPGDSFYAIDRSIEQLQYGWVRSNSTRLIATSLQQEERIIELLALTRRPHNEQAQLVLVGEIAKGFTDQPSDLDLGTALYRRLEEIAARQYLLLQTISQQLSNQSALASQVSSWAELRRPAYQSFLQRAAQEETRLDQIRQGVSLAF